MTCEIEFDIRVVPEVSEIVAWYVVKSISTAGKFETAFSWVMESLNTGIIEYARFNKEIKRAPVTGFPYLVY